MSIGCGIAERKGKVEISHNAAHRMVSISMMSFIKHYEPDILSQVNVAMTKSIKEDLRGRYYDTIVFQHSFPQGMVSPLIWLQRAVN